MSEAASIPTLASTIEPTSRLKTAAIYSGYGVFFLAALLVSLVLTFPNRQLKGFVESQARKAGYPMVIEEMALTGLGGVALEGVRLTLPQPKGKDGKPKSGEPTVVRLDKVSASVALWPLLSRQEVNADFSLAVDDGVIEDGHVVVRQGVARGDGSGGRGKRKKRGKRGKKGKNSAKEANAAKGGKGRKTTLIDLDIPTIDNLDLAKMGIAGRALSFTNKVQGDLRGTLSGSVSLHWEGTHEGAQGKIDLELTDAVLHNPAVAIDPKGPPLELRDLRLGVVTVKVRIDEKGRINLLKGKRGVDSSTAIHLAGVDIFGPDLELVAEERSHIIIPPGRSGMRQARMHVHLVFSLPKAKPSRGKSGTNGKSAEENSGRASWDMVREMMSGKFKRFMRSGYLGITCSGSLRRPSCVPSLPQVTVGLRKRARSEARAKAKKGGGAAKKKKAAAEAKKKADAEAKKKAAAEAKKKADAEAKKKAAVKTIDGKKVEFKPVVRPGAKTTPTPRTGAAKGAVKTEQRNKRADDDELDDEEEEDEAAADDEEDDPDEEEDDDPDAPKKAKKKGAKKKGGKKKLGADDEEADEEEPEE